MAERVKTGCQLSITYLGKEPSTIALPYKPDQLTWLFNTVDDFALAFAGYTGQIVNEYPRDKILSFATYHSITCPVVVKRQPILSALTVFTDGSSNGSAALVTPHNNFTWQLTNVSAQMAELYAVYQALLKFSPSLNIITDSVYIVHAIQMLETVPQINSKVTFIQHHLSLIQSLLVARTHPLYIGHIRSHTNLPGPLTAGNNLADQYTKIYLANLQKAEQFHKLHHVSARTLKRLYNLTREQARQIVKNCSACAPLLPVPHFGVNPRGLQPNDLWQMDVTHMPSFGRRSYLHVTIDTFSHFITATLNQANAHLRFVLTYCIAFLSLVFQKLSKLTMALLIVVQPLSDSVHNLQFSIKLEFPIILRAKVSSRNAIIYSSNNCKN